MKKCILSLLFAVAMSCTAVAKPHGSTGLISITTQPVITVNQNSIGHGEAVSVNYFHSGVLVSEPGMPGSAGEVRNQALKAASTSFLSWTQSITAMFARQAVEKNCLALAVYFESRSEPTRGQLAVAKVILNRTAAPHYPSSICGVVYQGASRMNGCQFSFACDGKADLPESGRAWQKAIAVANLALSGEDEIGYEDLQFVSTATHYHADYVVPYWSKSLSRLTKIGHHIFYL
jgi:spore germination cell wall hydrolase CwlJ-like protein